MTHVIFDLLHILDEAGIDHPVAGNVISERLGISRTAVWKYVNLLREVDMLLMPRQKPDTRFGNVRGYYSRMRSNDISKPRSSVRRCTISSRSPQRTHLPGR